ncbi:type II toxin-antitoxin system HicB family antitoxin [Thermomicrobium sp. 4228-Ro]|uniref:type II toxin-antitoxin system HicB family antitoxin n=1 Tax=Thermomicrobium sp. 4228-Ro TaxID=2993937 RepID=UPI0022493F7D|nr:type II toxin-antitoxin system HicB family antitoxin [Thermomicrobium sp. 4228-Ro]MCX2727966.1 type II toxin-antitoxin system HicB family antitoxin [Thermomicrobium sp. 4228-Ro]
MTGYLPWRVLAEQWETHWVGYVVELPGCQFAAATLDELLQRVPLAISSHVAWLRGHGLQGMNRPSDVFLLTERAQALPGQCGPLFDADRRNISAGELDVAIRVGEAAIEELLALAVRAHDWDTLPESQRPPGWPPPTVLRHVAEMDRWYAARLMPDIGALALPDDPREAVRRAHQAFVSGIRAWWAIWRDRVVERDGEQWTVAKVLRRRTGHLREHAEQLLAWVRVAGQSNRS